MAGHDDYGRFYFLGSSIYSFFLGISGRSMKTWKGTNRHGFGLKYHNRGQLPAGVRFIKGINAWIVRIMRNGHPTTISRHPNKELAQIAFDTATA